MNQRTELLWRLYLCFGLFMAIAAVLVYRSFHINVVEGDEWRSAGAEANYRTQPLEAERGEILADDGAALVSSQAFFEIRMDLMVSPLTDDLWEREVDSLAYYLSTYVNPDLSPARYSEWLRQHRRDSSRYLLLERKANYDLMQRISSFPILERGRYRGGLMIQRHDRRVKTYQQLASRTIGIVAGDRPSVGLENYYNDDLTGTPGVRVEQRIAGNDWIPVESVEEIEPHRGADIYTTINLQLQDAAHHALLNTLYEHQADKGVAVVMEVKTGAIKAIVNLRATGNGSYQELYNDAVGTAYEPGSTAKLASVMALLEDGYASVSSEVDVEYGRTTFYDRTLRDASPHGMRVISMQKAFEKSSNVGIAKLITRYYRGKEKERTFAQRLKQFGMDEITGIDLVGEAEPIIKDGVYGQDDWSGTSLPWMSCGYEMTMTPLQLLSLYNSVANDGKLMKPYLVDKIIADDKVVAEYRPKIVKNKIASAYTISTAQDLLKAVVERGTAENIKSPWVVLAGKTGTTQYDYANTQNKKTKYISSFAGYFPADEPRYSCVVVVFNPKGQHYYGSKVAAPVFRSIAEHTVRQNLEIMTDFEDASFESDQTISARGHHADMQRLMSDMNIEYRDQGIAEWVELEDYTDRPVSLQATDAIAEDGQQIAALGARDAVYALEEKGYKPIVLGIGNVRNQIHRNQSSDTGQRVESELR